MKILITDVETTGLSPKDSQIIELAFILYCTDSRTELCQGSTLLHAPNNPAEHINGISQKALDAAVSTVNAHHVQNQYLNLFIDLVAESDAIIAHNAKFDRGFIENQIDIASRPWVCSMTDLVFLKAGKSKRLTHLASDHGIHCGDAHRALGDCRTLLALLKTLDSNDLVAQVTRAINTKQYRAFVAYEDRQLPKAAGMTWNKDEKCWTGRFLQAEAKLLPFKVELIKD